MLADDTLWTGGPKDWNNPHARDVLPQVRDLVSQGHYSRATNLSLQMLGPYCQVNVASFGVTFPSCLSPSQCLLYRDVMKLQRAFCH